MTSGLEFDGKNVEIAIKKACDKLKIKEEKLKYDVISYGSTGIFGLVGTKKAKIRVTSPKHLKTIIHEERDNFIETDNILRETDIADIVSIVEESFGNNEIESVHRLPVEDDDSKNIDTANDETIKEDANKKDNEIDNEKNNEKDNEKDESAAIVAGEEVLKKIVELITNDAEISFQQRNKKVKYNVKGGNTAVLIGKKGQTLEAIQYIVEKIVNKKSLEKIKVHVDIEGYLENRRINLERLSTRLAEKSKRIGKPVTIGQLNSYDRRVVHLVLKKDSDVRTQSIGDGFYRKLVIFPKKNRK
jgi:spoIIIJ-associated protein